MPIEENESVLLFSRIHQTYKESLNGFSIVPSRRWGWGYLLIPWGQNYSNTKPKILTMKYRDLVNLDAKILNKITNFIP